MRSKEKAKVQTQADGSQKAEKYGRQKAEKVCSKRAKEKVAKAGSKRAKVRVYGRWMTSWASLASSNNHHRKDGCRKTHGEAMILGGVMASDC